MPISDDALQRQKNRFIAVKGDAKFGQAIAALNAVGGQPWWHLVAQMPDGSWSVARFGNLATSLEGVNAASDIRLRDLKALTPAATVERDSVDTKVAQAMARRANGGLLVVTNQESLVGILVEGVTRGAMSTPQTLDQLGGKYVNLKDYGSILLGSTVDQLGGKYVNLKDYREILLGPSGKRT